jgi:hypothetical protein
VNPPLELESCGWLRSGVAAEPSPSESAAYIWIAASTIGSRPAFTVPRKETDWRLDTEEDAENTDLHPLASIEATMRHMILSNEVLWEVKKEREAAQVNRLM